MPLLHTRPPKFQEAALLRWSSNFCVAQVSKGPQRGCIIGNFRGRMERPGLNPFSRTLNERWPCSTSPKRGASISVRSLDTTMRSHYFMGVSSVALIALGGYIAVALSSLPRQIARNSPERASVFRPLFFNFAADYDDGSVLGLAIGSTRDELFGAFQSQYAATGVLQAACGREDGAPPLTVAQSDVTLGEAGARELLDREVACLWLPARSIMLVFRFAGDRLHVVELSYVRNELNL